MLSRMTDDQYEAFRGRITQFLYNNGVTINGFARDVGMSHLTLRNFLYGRTKPYWVTIGRLERYINEYDGKTKK